jgi:hypothetical protein
MSVASCFKSPKLTLVTLMCFPGLFVSNYNYAALTETPAVQCFAMIICIHFHFSSTTVDQ